MWGKSSGVILGDERLEVETMAVGKFGRSVFQAGGTGNKPYSCLIISLRLRGASSECCS